MEHEARLAKWLKPAPKGSPSFFGPVMKRKRKRRKRRKRRTPRTSPAPLVAALVVDSGSGMLAVQVFLVMLLHALCSLRPSACLSFQASWPVCTRRTVARSSSTLAVAYPRVVLLLHLALCSFLLSLGLRCSASWPL